MATEYSMYLNLWDAQIKISDTALDNHFLSWRPEQTAPEIPSFRGGKRQIHARNLTRSSNNLHHVCPRSTWRWCMQVTLECVLAAE